MRTRIEVENEFKENLLKIKELTERNKSLDKEYMFISDKKQWFTE